MSNEISREPTSKGKTTESELSIGEVGLLEAFFDGVGLKSKQFTPEDASVLMKSIGTLYRVIVQGMMEVLTARFDLKNEFRMRHTQLQLKENNPLKFTGHVDDVLEYMFLKQTRGFLQPEAAFQEAFQDIKDHQFAMVVGMRAAFESLLQRFDPELMEKRFLKTRKIANILPIGRKAICWERFEEWYEDISADPEDDFQNLFGDAFSRAYEEQVAKLSSSRKKQHS
jgi:type VI secretion system FHA domain protein